MSVHQLNETRCPLACETGGTDPGEASSPPARSGSAAQWRIRHRQVLQLAVWRLRSNYLKELEIVVLRHELAILRRRTRRPAMTWTDRLFLAAVSRLLPRGWPCFIITPGTLLRWIGGWGGRGGRPPLQPGGRRPPAGSAPR